MKKCSILLALVLFAMSPLFSQAFPHIPYYTPTDTPPFFMVESSAGYALGVNLDNAAFFGLRLIYPFERFGFIIEGGGMFSQGESAFHFFLGPMVYIVNAPQWRVLLSLGLDIVGRETTILGVGSTLSFHRRLGNLLYAGVNLGIVYAFNHIYEVRTGYRTSRVIEDDGAGNPVFAYRTIPVYENRSHFGNRFHFRPSLLIGMQF